VEDGMITIKLTGIEEALQLCDPKNVQLAARATLNRAVTSARVVASEEIRKVYNLKASDLTPRLKVKPARLDNMTAILEITGKPMSLSYFGAKQYTAQGRMITRTVGKQMKRVSKSKMGVSVQVFNGKTTRLPNAFIATMKSGHVGVMRRLGKARKPIYEKNVITIPSMVENAKVMPSVLQRIQERLAVEFPRQLDYYMKRGK
jgi:hypothetical protein